MNIFQIPQIGNNSCDLVIGIIDTSGSMEPYWKWVSKNWNSHVDPITACTIVFDTIAQEVESNILEDCLDYHGGGGTNLYSAFALFEKKLKNLSQDTKISVLFISDGQDNNKTLCQKKLDKLEGNFKQKINFLCLGIGKDFPTFISMQLRQKYHTGDDTIPALFLIEYPSELAFKNKFLQVSDFMMINIKRKISPPVCTFPWKEYQSEVFENSWVMSHESKVTIEDQEMNISEFHLNMEGITELFRSWSQMIHLETLDENENYQIRAKKTLSLADDILDELKEVKGIDLLKILNQEYLEEQLSFKQKSWQNFVKNKYGRIKWFYEDIKNTALGNNIRQLDQFEAAKLIGKGTIMGNVQQKLAYSKGIKSHEFEKIKNEFRKIFQNTKLIPYSSQDVSVITLQNQKDVFLDEGFLEGLSYCSSQYDLIKSFPLIGIALKIRRPQKEKLDPWEIEVQNISKVHKVMDSTTIVLNNGGVQLQAGETVESITGVLPLFRQNDIDLQQLINSELYNLMMNQNVLNQVDFLIPNCYLSLLSHTLLCLFKKYEKNEFYDEILDGIIETEQMISKNNHLYKKFKQDFIADPVKALENDEESLQYKNVLYPKGILAGLVLSHQKLLPKDQLKKLLKYLGCVLISQVKEDFLKFAKLEFTHNKEKLNDVVLNTMRDKYELIFTKGDFHREFHQVYLQVLQFGDCELNWQIQKGLDSIKDKVLISYELIKNLCQFLGMSGLITEEDWKTFICLTMEGHKPVHYDFLQDEALQMEKRKGEKKLIDLLKPEAGKVQNKKLNHQKLTTSLQYLESSLNCYQDFQKYFVANHKFVIPPSKQEMSKHNIQVHLSDGLPRGCCMSQKCPFYMKPTKKRISHHLLIWENQLPKGFHKILKFNHKKTAVEVYNIFMNENTGFDMKLYDTSKEEIFAYIEKMKEYYKDNQFQCH